MMLNLPADAPRSDQEWQAFLKAQWFGQLIAPVANEKYPLLVPTPYRYDGSSTIELHLHRKNPVVQRLRQSESAILSVVDAVAYVPSASNTADGDDPKWAAPTSYYAAVQAQCTAVVIEDPSEIAELLSRQMKKMQPEGGYAPIRAGHTAYGRMLSAICGIRMRIDEVSAKFKFGGNKGSRHRQLIAEHLAKRGREADLRSRKHLLSRLVTELGGSVDGS
jgi:transcriptional regulator